MTETSFNPCYVWPNDVIPFRSYFINAKLRIFIIENLQHNFIWLRKYKNKIRETDVFVVIVGCYYHEWLVDEADRMFAFLGLNKSNFFILFNDERDSELFKDKGFFGEIINHNAWLDEKKTMLPRPVSKKYDAVYVARLINVKRHWLANKINNLAVVTSTKITPEGMYTGNWVFRNEDTLDEISVSLKINESLCGLVLSDKEGACFASSEYLLCGVPVISTKSEGGRDVWYNKYNSIIVDDDVDDVCAAVEFFKSNPRDPQIIRSEHVNLQYFYRSKFIVYLDSLFKERGVINVSAVDYFWETYMHKMRGYIKPNFEEIFI